MEPPIGRLVVAAPVEEVAMDLCQEDGLEESIEQIYECHRHRSSHAMLVVALCTFTAVPIKVGVRRFQAIAIGAPNFALFENSVSLRSLLHTLFIPSHTVFT
jgi:hypothetical protein